MDLSKNNQYNSRSETVEMGRKLHTAATVRERCRQNILEIKKRPPVRKDRIKRIRSNFWLYAQKGEEGDKYDKTGE